jgi:hypothetical protein
MYSDADKRFFAMSKAQTLLANQTGSLARAYDAQGVFKWAEWSSTGSLVVAASVRDDVVGTEATLASLTGAVVGVTSDRAAELQAFYVAQLNAARQDVDTYVRAKAAALAAESARIGQLVNLKENAFKIELSNLVKFSAQRARIAQYAADARELASGNQEWSAKVEASVANYLFQQAANEKGILKVRLSTRATKIEAQTNAVLKSVVDRAVAAGTADQVIAKFKDVRSKIPALLDRDLSDSARYLLLFMSAKIDEFVAKVEG